MRPWRPAAAARPILHRAGGRGDLLVHLVVRYALWWKRRMMGRRAEQIAFQKGGVLRCTSSSSSVDSSLRSERDLSSGGSFIRCTSSNHVRFDSACERMTTLSWQVKSSQSESSFRLRNSVMWVWMSGG